MKNTVKNILKGQGYSIKNLNKVRKNIYSKLAHHGIKNKINSDLLYSSFKFLKKIEDFGHVYSIVEEKEGRLILIVNYLKFYVESKEDIFIISEVLIYKEYNFLQKKDNSIVIDIGLNIGITSIFFAQNKNVKHIYSYEPLPHTYKIACENIKLNMINKVTPKNVGLGGYERKDSFLFNPKFKANVGSRNEGNYVNNSTIEKDSVEVLIIDVYEEFNLIRKAHPTEDIVFKIDCEGGEYEIINRLNEKGLLKYIELLMIEWHDKGPKPLENILLENGFKLLSRVIDKSTGMIYAFKI